MSNLSQLNHNNTLPPLTFTNSTLTYEFSPLLPNLAQLQMEPNPTYLSENLNFLNTPKTFKFMDLIFEFNDSLEGDIDIALDSVFVNKSPTLVSFFSAQMIDIPLCFGKSKSLHYLSAANPQTRLINMLTRHGRRLYTAKMYTFSLHQLSTLFKKGLLEDNELTQWRALYTGFVKSRYSITETSFIGSDAVIPEPLVDLYGQEHDQEHYLADGANWVHGLLYEEIAEYKPTFSFYIRKVDKMKRKHSRGKSGKYAISWKYVPQYKRMLTVLRWLVKDVRFQKPKTFQQRINLSLETLLFSKTNHLAYQLRQFVHRFVFQNFKKTLLKTLRSTS